MSHRIRNKQSSARSARKIYLFSILTGFSLAVWILTNGAQIKSEIIQYYLKTPDQSKMATEYDDVLTEIDQRIQSLKIRYQKFSPARPYLIISTSDNQILLMKKNVLLHEGPCSSGSYILLKTRDNREWMFNTPRGIFKINMKLKEPVWYMPDWAFIEEGRDIPPPNSPERFDHNALGDYALSFGQGYLIHGTIYKRLIGQPVTHGCVRLDDDDLHKVYQYLKYGARVYIY